MYHNNSKETSGTHSTILRTESFRNYIPNTVKIQKGELLDGLYLFIPLVRCNFITNGLMTEYTKTI